LTDFLSDFILKAVLKQSSPQETSSLELSVEQDFHPQSEKLEPAHTA